MAKTPEIINGKVVSRWFTRGKARIPIFEDGTIGLPDGSLRELKKEDFGRHEYKQLEKEAKFNHYENEVDKIDIRRQKGKLVSMERRNELYKKQVDAFNEMELFEGKQKAYRGDTSNLEGKHIRNINTGITKQEETANIKQKLDKKDRLKKGVEIYYKGDMANTPGTFTIEDYDPSKEQFMSSITLKEKGGENRTMKIGSISIENDYTNNYATRFAFKEDYDDYRNKIYEQYSKRMNLTSTQESDLEFTKKVIDEVKTSKVDRISSKADMELKKETQRITQKPTVADVRKELRNMQSWSDEKQYGDMVITKTGNTGYHVRNVADESDPMTDYFAGVYGVKEKQVLNMLQEKGIVEKQEIKAKVERFRERKGTTSTGTNKKLTKRELAEKIVDSQIKRGIVRQSNREMLINSKMNMSKEELEKYFQ